ncbi:uncharacterized protein LOC127882320 [Dreissena polymorpha]|uniref:uncharacterized protein LOC127882320 n=1 Tax=Dreissena polymorpha TaxID=45954 RepID=UPI0022652D5B|nr:uncharacterized protein LOC127882320 [Dreissena polymorpha]
MQNVTDTGHKNDLTTVVMECATYCRSHNISNPVDILRIYQERTVIGRPLEINEDNLNTGIEGETNFIMVDRSNLIQTAFDEISTLTVNNLRKCLEVQFYGETAVDYGGPRKEFFSLILQQLQKEYFDPLREWSNDYEVVGKIMALSTVQNGRLPRLMSEEVLQEVFVSESPRPFALDLRKGLNSLGIVQLTLELPTFMHLFTPVPPMSLTLKMTTSLLVPFFSSEGSNRRQKETSMYSTFIKYMREAASGRRREVSLGSILKFATGTEEEPVLGFCIKPSIHFVEADTFLPTANTCVNRLNLTIPHGSLAVTSQDELFEMFDLAFCNTYFGLQ